MSRELWNMVLDSAKFRTYTCKGVLIVIEMRQIMTTYTLQVIVYSWFGMFCMVLKEAVYRGTVKGTLDSGVRFRKCQNFNFQEYCYSDRVGSNDDMKNTPVIVLALVGMIFMVLNKKQGIMEQTTTEAEYKAVISVVNQAL